MFLDPFMTKRFWAPRLIPFLVYAGFLFLFIFIREPFPWAYPFVYALQCGLVAWLLWRYRHLLPELTISFHWLAVPVGLGVAAVWIWLRFQTVRLIPFLAHDKPPESFFQTMGPALGWLALAERLVGMAILVPLFEELCMRSLMLRCFHRPRLTLIGLLQILEDIPLIGDWIITTSLGDRVSKYPAVFKTEFHSTPLGRLSLFGVAASTLIFTVHHAPIDYPGCIVCSIAYCLLLRSTAHKGLGPVCWAHGITNATLWFYTLYTHFYTPTPDWQFLA